MLPICAFHIYTDYMYTHITHIDVCTNLKYITHNMQYNKIYFIKCMFNSTNLTFQNHDNLHCYSVCVWVLNMLWNQTKRKKRRKQLVMCRIFKNTGATKLILNQTLSKLFNIYSQNFIPFWKKIQCIHTFLWNLHLFHEKYSKSKKI